MLPVILIEQGQGSGGPFRSNVYGDILLMDDRVLEKIFPDLVVVVVPAQGIYRCVHISLGKMPEPVLVQKSVYCTEPSAVIGFLREPYI